MNNKAPGSLPTRSSTCVRKLGQDGGRHLDHPGSVCLRVPLEQHAPVLGHAPLHGQPTRVVKMPPAEGEGFSGTHSAVGEHQEEGPPPFHCSCQGFDLPPGGRRSLRTIFPGHSAQLKDEEEGRCAASCLRLGRQKCGALGVPMPSCWTCEQFLYLIKTQRRPRRFCRFGQRMSGCHVGQVEAIPEAGPGALLRHLHG